MELAHTAIAPGRLSEVLKKEMGLSTGLINRFKWQGSILVNGVPRHTDFTVAAGDLITAAVGELPPVYPAEDGPLEVLFEDAYLLAVDKPAGMLIHPSRAQLEGTLANRVVGYYRRTGQDCIFHPVTRLDRDTFGIVLLAKNSHIHAGMNALHREGRIEKRYHALVLGAPAEDSGRWEAPIARTPPPSLLREIRPDGKPSVTDYQVLERLENRSRLELRPITGRTHQLRVHCAHFGFPILGDPQYNTPQSQALSVRLGLQTQALCAVSLRFPHPVTGEILQLRSRMDAVC